jgi:hypothetical protein
MLHILYARWWDYNNSVHCKKKAFCKLFLTTLCLGEEVWAFHAHVVRQIAIMFGKAANTA